MKKQESATTHRTSNKYEESHFLHIEYGHLCWNWLMVQEINDTTTGSSRDTDNIASSFAHNPKQSI